MSLRTSVAQGLRRGANMPPLTMREIQIIAMACLVVGALAIGYMMTPPNTFSPFCSYDMIYRLRATIEVDGQRYDSTATLQNITYRWLSGFLTQRQEHCRPSYGTALAFHLNDGRVVLIKPDVCSSARSAVLGGNSYKMARKFHSQADLLRHCMGSTWDVRSIYRGNSAHG